ncbi:MAG TPA: zf-HC2 domain-containing protein [Candidatus Krumholzibacteria bacterium]|nr:zf-HC2 domain-containing protein [Candidatus Krumholzibacteria bacterium]
MTCERAQEMMVDALYGELEAVAAREFEQHLATCAACAALLEELRATGAAMRERTRPDPGEEYWETYYARLEARMQREQPAIDSVHRSARRRSYVSWGYRVAAAVAVLAAGVWIGRSSLPHAPGESKPVVALTQPHTATDTTTPGSLPAQDNTHTPATQGGGTVRDAINGPASRGPETTGGGNVQLASADVRARDYIERSQVLLLALVNATDDTTAIDYDLQRQRAGALVREAAVLHDDLPGSDNRRLRDLVTELQLILREIANMENQKDLAAVQIIRNRVSREGVLMKIDVEQMREDAAPTTAPPVKRKGAID